MEFIYSTLLLTHSEDVMEKYKKLSLSIDAKATVLNNSMEALEHLMDNKANAIIIDCCIGRDETIEFLQHLSNDYENMTTPIIIIHSSENLDEISQNLLEFNVLSVEPLSTWEIHTEKLLRYFRLLLANVFFIQNSLIESEDRGAIDQLTGAYNRYGCEDVFHTLTARVKAYNEPFCIVMADIDHFKKVNDIHGHDIGDEVLQCFSSTILNSIRRDDSLIRLGGEEFLIFLSNINISTANKIAENLRAKIESNPQSSKKLSITSSFGVVQYKQDEEYDSILKRVDKLLYQAKDSGRNKVISETM